MTALALWVLVALAWGAVQLGALWLVAVLWGCVREKGGG